MTSIVKTHTHDGFRVRSTLTWCPRGDTWMVHVLDHFTGQLWCRVKAHECPLLIRAALVDKAFDRCQRTADTIRVNVRF